MANGLGFNNFDYPFSLQGICNYQPLIHKFSNRVFESPKMVGKEVTSAQDLVDPISNAGDKLVALDFFSPGCGGCKPLQPKICQFAEMFNLSGQCIRRKTSGVISSCPQTIEENKRIMQG